MRTVYSYLRLALACCLFLGGFAVQFVPSAAAVEREALKLPYRTRLIRMGVAMAMERIDPAAREIQSRESEWLVRRWDHLVRVRPAGDGQTLYSDEIIIEAGWATFFVWLFAHWFYRHRQRRWRRVARRLAAAEQAAAADRPRD